MTLLSRMHAVCVDYDVICLLTPSVIPLSDTMPHTASHQRTVGEERLQVVQ